MQPEFQTLVQNHRGLRVADPLSPAWHVLLPTEVFFFLIRELDWIYKKNIIALGIIVVAV